MQSILGFGIFYTQRDTYSEYIDDTRPNEYNVRQYIEIDASKQNTYYPYCKNAVAKPLLFFCPIEQFQL